jgi:hypothetical protein
MSGERQFYDVYAAALALCRGVELVRVVPGNWVCFAFQNGHGEADAVLDEWRNGASVGARDYAEAVKRLKRLARTAA